MLELVALLSGLCDLEVVPVVRAVMAENRSSSGWTLGCASSESYSRFPSPASRYPSRDALEWSGFMLAMPPPPRGVPTRTPPAPHEIEAGDEGTRYGVGSSPREQTATNQQLLLRPVVGFRIGAGPNDEHDDQVTIRGSSHLQTWGRSREDDGIGARRSIVAAKALRQALDATHASNRMRLASFRLVTR